MKKIYLLLIGLISLNLSAQKYQIDIDHAFNLFIATQNMKDLDNIITDLEKQSQGKDNRYLSYWTAYAKYKKSLGEIETAHQDAVAKKEGKKALNEAIKIINQIEHKTSEDYALLAILKNYSVAYCSPVKVPFVSGEAKKFGELALNLDDKNIRAYLALGIRDYYTPVMYGGGKKFERYFQQAITYEDKYSDNPYDPSWGKNEAYYYLILYYIKTDMEKARATLKEGLEHFPEDIRLNSLK